MVKIIQNENAIKIGKEPIVILPLKEWEKFGERMEELEDAIRFNKAFSDSRNQKLIPFAEVKKKFNLS